MDWSAVVVSVLSGIGGAGAVLGLAVWPGKTWLKKRIERSVDHVFDERMERLKADLRVETEKAIQDHAASLKHGDEQTEADRNLFREFIALLPTDSGAIEHLQSSGRFGKRWEKDATEPLQRFICTWDVADKEFLDPDIERARKNFMDATRRFYAYLARATFPSRRSGDQNINEVPPEMARSDYQRYTRTVDQILELGDEVLAAHSELVRCAKRKLRI